MIKSLCVTIAALCCIGSPGSAATPREAQIEEEKVLGSVNEQARQQSYLPFTRRLNATGVVKGTLDDSVEAAGVPAVAALEVLRAFSAAIDLDEDLINGDSFSLSYLQEYTVEGHPIGVPQVMWVELRTAARGTLSVHRFRASRSKQDRLWLATGEGTGPTVLRWPVDEINISSGFGLRRNPIVSRAPKAKQVRRPKGTGGPPVLRGSIGRYALLMHRGIDFAAETGTPIHAAAAGTVTGARPNGGYGNWIEIRHEGELATVYGHLSAFAPGLSEGVWVERGQLIGFVGSTGRSTGPHLHFELQQNGVATNPVVHPGIRPAQMRGGDLERFRRVVARNLDEARR